MEGNQMKLRKALMFVYDWILKAGYVHGYPDTRQKRRQLYDMMTKALSAHPRNCDVGTAEEQAERFKAYCVGRRCRECPWPRIRSCDLAWAQMPYDAQEGGAK